MFYVYVLRNESGRTYTGHTQDLKERLNRHNTNQEISTKNRGPWLVVYSETLKTRSEAVKREKELKSGTGRDWIKKILLPAHG